MAHAILQVSPVISSLSDPLELLPSAQWQILRTCAKLNARISRTPCDPSWMRDFKKKGPKTPRFQQTTRFGGHIFWCLLKFDLQNKQMNLWTTATVVTAVVIKISNSPPRVSFPQASCVPAPNKQINIDKHFMIHKDKSWSVWVRPKHLCSLKDLCPFSENLRSRFEHWGLNWLEVLVIGAPCCKDFVVVSIKITSVLSESFPFDPTSSLLTWIYVSLGYDAITSCNSGVWNPRKSSETRVSEVVASLKGNVHLCCPHWWISNLSLSLA